MNEIPPPPLKPQSRAILLVEDNADDEALTMRALKRNKIANDVFVARDGEEALEMLHGEERIIPSIVLLDLKLPKVDGLEVLRQIRADRRTKLLPVIIMTSSKEDRDLIEGYSLGANSYIRKPVDFNQFAESVRQMELYWLVLNEPPPSN